MELHSERNLSHLSESLTKRREWLIENQQTEVEALTMQPKSNRMNKTTVLKKLLLEGEDHYDAGVITPAKVDAGKHDKSRKQKCQ